MRVDDEDLDAYLAGSTSGDSLEVTAWRGGQVVADGLGVQSWSLPWDASRQVQGQATVTVSDPDGSLIPWALDDPLGPGGSRLQIVCVCRAGQPSEMRIPLGWWRIRKARPAQAWRQTRVGDAMVLTPAGGSITIWADEETDTVVKDRLDAESPAPGATCLSEVRRLLDGIVPVDVADGVTDRPYPVSVVYDESRMDAVQDLLTAVGATYRMGGDGTFEVVPRTGVPTSLTLAGGDGGLLVQVDHELSDDGIYNAVKALAETDAGRQLIARRYVESGPLTYGVDQPYGRVIRFKNSVGTTQAAVNTDADTTLATASSIGEIDVPVDCVAHPGVQLHDQVTVLSPTTAGDQPLRGVVVGMTLTSATADAGTVPAKRMSLSVRVAAADLAALSWRVRRG